MIIFQLLKSEKIKQYNSLYEQANEKNHITDKEKVFDKNQHPFIRKILRKLETEVNFLNLLKKIYKKPKSNIILNGEILFSLKNQKQGKDVFSHHFYSIQHWNS